MWKSQWHADKPISEMIDAQAIPSKMPASDVMSHIGAAERGLKYGDAIK